MRDYSVGVVPLCCYVASERSIFLAGTGLIRLISADIVVYVVYLVWPAAMVISGSYACLWSSAGRAEPHTSQHLVASRPSIPYTYLSFPAVCCVLPNSFSYCSTPDVHRKQDGGEACFFRKGVISVYSCSHILQDLIKPTRKHCNLVSCCYNYFHLHENLCFLLKKKIKVVWSMQTLRSVWFWLVGKRMNHRGSRLGKRWIILWWCRQPVTLLNMWPRRRPSWCNCIFLVTTCLALKDQRP